MILRQGETVDYFFMIESGAVEIVVNNEQSNEMSLACLGSGQFFGEVELTQGGQSIASVRAAKGGAKVALLPKEIFYKLIDDSPRTRMHHTGCCCHTVGRKQAKEVRPMSGDIKPNILKPRWSKVFSDLWDDKTRTALVVASIAVGVFAVGMIITAFFVLSEDINTSYAAANPVNIEIWTDPFYEDLVRVIEKVPGVDDVEGRQMIPIRARKGNENWQGLTLVGIKDFDKLVINQLGTIDGTKIPGRKRNCCQPGYYE